MRKIKFRGKCINLIYKDERVYLKWIYGDLHKVHNAYFIYLDDNEWYEVDKNTIGQFTGMKDKDGNEIYENDIIEYTFDLPGSYGATINGLKKRIGEINWCEWRSSFAVYGWHRLSNSDLFNYIRNGNTVKVIGNALENPELLQQK